MYILSPFLCLFKTKKNGCLAYSGMTNSFMKINDNLFNLLKKASLNMELLSGLDRKTFETLKYAKVICTQEEIDNAINQKKFLRGLDTFGNEYLNLTIAPTSSCNFACPYCFEKGIKHETMDDKTVTALLNFIEKKSEYTNKTVSIMWYGGEPLLAIKKIDRIMVGLNERNINILYNGIVTNGYYLDKTNQKKLKKYNN